MELYGKGLPLGPDAGIGLTLYSGQDYLEYYSQFPAHNTVCVDGISAYPVMKSNHAAKMSGGALSLGDRRDLAKARKTPPGWRDCPGECVGLPARRNADCRGEQWRPAF